MAEEDLLVLPQVPEAKPGDPEDVSWALSTAEAMWARGEHAEGVKWIRKAAEAASDAEDDNRALELAKAASDLTATITRRSLASPAEVISSTAAPSANAAPTSSDAPATSSSKAAASVRPAPPLPTKGRSAPPLPTKGKSAPPPAVTPSASIPPVAPRTSQPPRASQAPRGAPRPLVVNAPTPLAPPVTAPAAPATTQQPATVQAVALAAAQSALAAAQSAESLKETRTDTKKSKRRSRENIDVDAAPSSRRRSRPDADPTIIGNVKDLTADASAPPSTKPFDTTLNGPASRDGDRMTALGAPPRIEHVKNGGPSSSANQHDPEIRTSQAVRVVVWRDATGVHVAPAGTVVSAITVDAVLVALEPSADLTAWLSERTR